MPKTETPRRKRNADVYEVPVTAPRMNALEKARADSAAKLNMAPEQYDEKIKDTAIGFAGPMALSKFDLRKMSKLKRLGETFLSRASSGADNVAKAAVNETENKYARGGRIDGIAQRGKTKGRMR